MLNKSWQIFNKYNSRKRSKFLHIPQEFGQHIVADSLASPTIDNPFHTKKQNKTKKIGRAHV